MEDDETDPPPVWHVISGDTLLEQLRRVAQGEDPEMVYLELFANGRHDHIDDDSETD